MRETVDVYWSFRSPYSYLVGPDLLRLASDFEVYVRLRIVLPIAIRSKQTIFDPDNRKPADYIQIDYKRRAEFLGMPVADPNPDPIVQNMDTFEVSEEQPYIYRLVKLGVEAERRGKGIYFAVKVSRLIFGGTADWHEGNHIENAVNSIGLDLGEMEMAIRNGDHLDEVEENQRSLDRAGHWGVPTMVFREEPFFGQDRIDTLRWRLENCGLKK